MRRTAFTLIELLIVVSIVAILAGAAMPMVAMANRSARKQATQAVMGKIDAALRQFKQDFLAYPYQSAYPGNDLGWNNRLRYHLGTDISGPNLLKVRADMDAAEARYAYPLINYAEPTTSIAAAPHMIRYNRQDGKTTTGYFGEWGGSFGTVSVGDLRPTVWSYRNSQWYPNWHSTSWTAHCAFLNRIAGERARVIVASGNLVSGGLVIPDSRAPDNSQVLAGRDCSGNALVSSPQSEAKPGFAADYLGESLGRRHIDLDDPERLLDAWGNPIIYICRVLPGVRAACGKYNNGWFDDLHPADYGMDTIGRTSLMPRSLDGKTTSLPADGAALPDPMQLRRSDVRKYAAPGMEREFELWSGGPDGQFHVIRTDPENRDNVPYRDYNKGLP